MGGGNRHIRSKKFVEDARRTAALVSAKRDCCVETYSDDEEAETAPRKRILSFIRSRPGAHLRLVERELGITMGALQHHVRVLEKEQKIVSRRRGAYKRFYPNLVFAEQERTILDILSQETERDILLFLIKKPGATQKDLSELVKVSATSVIWHMKRLTRAGIVEARREDRFVRYYLTGDPSEILRLLKGYHPSIWDKWADRLANAFEAISKEEEK